MKKLPLCESLGCIAKIKKCTDTCLAAHGCPDALHDYFETPNEVVEEMRKQFKPVPIEPCTDHKWSEHEIHEITNASFRRALDKRLSHTTITIVADKPLSEIANSNANAFDIAPDCKIEIGCVVKPACPACNDTGIVDGEFDGALECACKKGTNQ